MSLLDVLSQKEPGVKPVYGVSPGIVTNVGDPESLGRVKIKFPWLSDDNETGWVRVVTFMAGSRMGGYFLPRVGDEVLVAFHNGDINSPYVLGSLWNGAAPPPGGNDSGDNNIRQIISRSGHTILLDDTPGSEKIEITDQTGGNKIIMDSTAGAITIESAMQLNIKAASIKITSAAVDFSILPTVNKVPLKLG